ncbi:MAG: SsrA-binding protein SmpB [Buchnera aphidicola (Periphyllus lyropictus)]|uniref:SsrA-binding protein SmpB n=1 Tax=Buchnera aphidicola TaxID=9 RepID=UPI001EC9C8F8|nr:SsrA-binding protein SmpB [Buchnera aphidicola]NIH16623.1 SsrA-binding protein SmpB [Buchnera aphidicola (Periphyllus lyropictus)]USS94535.1 SsrA-binding protein SmpB [Buchnera aphidicola (Periphyllus lyropictus)]
MLIKKKYYQKKIISVNKKAKHNFFIKKIFTAGISLKGWEVKSIRKGKINISNSYVLLRSCELFLFNCEIQPLKTTNVSFSFINNFNRNRKLLLLRKEIDFISSEMKKFRYTVIPISIFWKKSFCKLKIGLAIGKKLYDKRKEKKNKVLKRELSRISKKFKI